MELTPIGSAKKNFVIMFAEVRGYFSVIAERSEANP